MFNKVFRFSLTLLLSLSTITFLATPSHAAKGYRYWGYFQAPAGSTTWTAAMTGPSVEVRSEEHTSELQSH